MTEYHPDIRILAGIQLCKSTQNENHKCLRKLQATDFVFKDESETDFESNICLTGKVT